MYVREIGKYKLLWCVISPLIRRDSSEYVWDPYFKNEGVLKSPLGSFYWKPCYMTRSYSYILVPFILGCYGINEEDKDDDSDKSNETDSLTEPWFCDACQAGVQPVSKICCGEVCCNMGEGFGSTYYM